jgi:hypothetical protein
MPIPGDQIKSGWGVVRLGPWHLAGMFALSADAEKLAHALGPAYAVSYGDHIEGTTEFSFTSNPSA